MTVVTGATKECRVCGEVRAATEFRKEHRRCATCTAKYMREYREKNAEKLREGGRQWYAENREHKLAYREQYHATHREDINERRREWYDANREAEAERNHQRYWQNPRSFREYSRRWTQEHPERNVAAAHKRRARVRALEVGDHDVAYMVILRADPCSYCGSVAGTIDHIEPLYSGGDGRWENLTASCRGCNSSKHTATLLAFLRRAKAN